MATVGAPLTVCGKPLSPVDRRVWQQAIALLMGLKVRNDIGEKDLAGAVEMALHHRAGGSSAPEVNNQPTGRRKARLGLGRIVVYCRSYIRFTAESLTYSVPLYLKRQCDRTLGTADQSRCDPGPCHSQMRGLRGEGGKPGCWWSCC